MHSRFQGIEGFMVSDGQAQLLLFSDPHSFVFCPVLFRFLTQSVSLSDSVHPVFDSPSTLTPFARIGQS